MRKVIALAVLLSVAIFMLAGCGGSSTTTPHGTYTDLEGFSPLNVGQSCQMQEAVRR